MVATVEYEIDPKPPAPAPAAATALPPKPGGAWGQVVQLRPLPGDSHVSPFHQVDRNAGHPEEASR